MDSPTATGKHYVQCGMDGYTAPVPGGCVGLTQPWVPAAQLDLLVICAARVAATTRLLLMEPA